MKRLIVCCDGTWEKLGKYPTNVVKLAQSVKPVDTEGIHQVVYYDEGVGTGGFLDNLLGGATGKGLGKNVQDAYRFLCLNYTPGDEIYLFGFSRGAYTVRSLAGFIYNSGLLQRRYISQAPKAYELYASRGTSPKTKEAIDFRKKYGQRYEEKTYIPITLLGCWDTVGSLGIPNLNPMIQLDSRINQKYRFHDTKLNPMIQYAFHGVAIDEKRQVFGVTPMQLNTKAKNQILKQIWFPGDHGCVGGGTKKRRYLSDATLKWMIDSITEEGLGLQCDPNVVEDGINIQPEVKLNFTPSSLTGKLTLWIGTQWREVSDTFEDIHATTLQRFSRCPKYRPKNLLEKHQHSLKSYLSEVTVQR